MQKSKIALSVLLFLTVITFLACSNEASDSGSEKKEKPTYTVTYVDGVNGLDISVPSDSNKYHEGDTVTVKFTGIGIRENYTFAGWSDGNNTFTSNGTKTFEMGSTDVTLTALWKFDYIGTKAPSEAKAVGDIVFNDGSAMPYTSFDSLDATEKDAKKSSAIALIFYKGTELNSGDDNTTSRTLGVGLKHNKGGLAWCTSTANAFDINISTIQCFPNGVDGVFTFTGDKNGSDNLEQISAFLTATDGVDDDTSTESNYPAFYFGKNYKDVIGSNLKGTAYETGWYLPSLAELYHIWKCRADTVNGFDIDSVSETLGGDKFPGKYLSSSQWEAWESEAYRFRFDSYGNWDCTTDKTSKDCICCIREFNQCKGMERCEAVSREAAFFIKSGKAN